MLRIAGRLRTAITIIKSGGSSELLRYSASRIVETYHERRLGIDTARYIKTHDAGITNPDAVAYCPIAYASFFRVMRELSDIPGGSFIDFGSGLGRVVCCAATMPFKRVTGVELSAELHRKAVDNIAKARPRFRCQDVVLLRMNAADFQISSDMTVFHFFNPFHRETLRAVISNIARSLAANPRLIRIVFASPWEMSEIMKSGEIIPHVWQQSSLDVKWPFRRDIGARDPDGFRYRIYTVQPN